jgi:predicted Zn-dependent protease
MNLQSGNYFKHFIFIVFLFSILITRANFAQNDLIKDILQTANVLNETLLDLTTLSDEEENIVGDELDKQISKDLRIAKERKFNLNRIFNKLIQHITRTEINYSYKVVETDEVNDYAIAGGRMYINTGI